ncbi:hypothetical protein BT69DRAFT_1334779 [Atractiella rhizophila]|nr:hypothetical protein BT69DRAFT_1334779 [Atractiella rhizophila]
MSSPPTPPQSGLVPTSNQQKITPHRTTSRTSFRSQASQPEVPDEAKLRAAQETAGRFVYIDAKKFLDMLPYPSISTMPTHNPYPGPTTLTLQRRSALPKQRN